MGTFLRLAHLKTFKFRGYGIACNLYQLSNKKKKLYTCRETGSNILGIYGVLPF